MWGQGRPGFPLCFARQSGSAVHKAKEDLVRRSRCTLEVSLSTKHCYTMMMHTFPNPPSASPPPASSLSSRHPRPPTLGLPDLNQGLLTPQFSRQICRAPNRATVGGQPPPQGQGGGTGKGEQDNQTFIVTSHPGKEGRRELELSPQLARTCGAAAGGVSPSLT